MKAWTNRGIAFALASAILFGVSTPFAKALVGAVPPLLLAGLLYAGSGVGLALVMGARRLRSPEGSSARLPPRAEWGWLASAIFFGGVAGPIALMQGLVTTSASAASLLLNLEAVFTALIAWFLFRENFGWRVVLGMMAIVAGGLLLAWTPGGPARPSSGLVLVAAACLCWAIDNNVTRRISASDAVTIACLKGSVAGAMNLALAFFLGATLPAAGPVGAAALVGFLGYGVSLVLFVLALRHLGTARTSAYFAVAPFFGAALSFLLQDDPVTWQFIAASGLMAAGVWLHLREHHEHPHAHEAEEHTHPHVHDQHHRHPHVDWDGREPHTHAHRHEPLVHTHAHYPDVHHRHPH